MLEELAAAVRRRSISATELVRTSLERIERLNPALNAFVHVDTEGAERAARELDAHITGGGDAGPLAGIPFGVKDLEDAVGQPTGKGSRWFAGGPPAARDDIHVARLRAAGAIPVGKTATPEFGSAAFTASLAFGVTRNPWNLTRTPGGSSGGSAAAVTAGIVPFCTASDGGGSIRGPASFTGLPGLRPSYGRVPTYGSTHVAQNAVNFALATTVADTALLLDLCARPDRRDRTCLPEPAATYTEAIERLDVAGLRAAFSIGFGFASADDEVATLTQTAFAQLCRCASMRPVAVDVTLPSFLDTYVKIEGVDRWIALPDGLWPERAAEINPSLLPSWESASRARLPQLSRVFTERRRLEQAVADLFDRFDVLVTPTIGFRAFAAEGPLPEELNGRPVHPFTGLAQPILASLCNLPAMSVPAGVTGDGLPVGMQIIGSQHREDVCLRLARLFELSHPWACHAPGYEEFVSTPTIT